MEGIRKAMNERNLNEGQWEDRKQWSLGVGQRRTTFWNRYIYIYIYIYIIAIDRAQHSMLNYSFRWGSHFPGNTVCCVLKLLFILNSYLSEHIVSLMKNINICRCLWKVAVIFPPYFNPLTPKDTYSDRTATLTSKCCILYIYSTNTGTAYFKHGIHCPFFPLQNAVCFIILTYLVPVLFTFYIEFVLKFKKIIPAPKV